MHHELTLSSPSFKNMSAIPPKHTCDGRDLIPSLKISGVKKNVKSLVLIMDDPDAPMGVWDHWVAFNIPPDTRGVEEGREPPGLLGKGTDGKLGYHGPCPPNGEHRYVFKLYALDTMLDIKEGATKAEVEEVMEGRILQQTQLMGVYKR